MPLPGRGLVPIPSIVGSVGAGGSGVACASARPAPSSTQRKAIAPPRCLRRICMSRPPLSPGKSLARPPEARNATYCKGFCRIFTAPLARCRGASDAFRHVLDGEAEEARVGGDVELALDLRDAVGDRAIAQLQRAGDLGQAFAGAEEPQHVELA